MVWSCSKERRAINTLERKCELIQVEGTKNGRGRPKITLVDVIKRTFQLSNEKYDFK